MQGFPATSHRETLGFAKEDQLQTPTMCHAGAPNFDEAENAVVMQRVFQTLGLVDAPPEDEFDRFTRLACNMLDVPVALVSIVQEDLDRQYFKSAIGLTGIWAEQRQTPLSHSFCQIVKRQNRPLVVEYAPDDVRVHGNLAITELNVRAYLGVPINGPDGAPIGALCAIDSRARHWRQSQTDAMVDLAACVDDQIQLRARRHGIAVHA